MTERSGGRKLVAGYVLAGGASSRFGEDKAFVKLGGIPMLVRMVDLLMKVSGKAFVVGGSEEQYRAFDVDFVADRWPREGPLGGILTALGVSAKSPDKPEWNLVISCDMPFLTSEWLAHVCERAAASDAEVVVPRSPKGFEPLCACWRTDACPTLESAFGVGVRKVTEGMKRLKSEVLDEAEWKRFDTHERLFWNMNTREDYEEARLILEMEQGKRQAPAR